MPAKIKAETTQEKTLIQSDYETLADFRFTLRQFLHFSEEAAHEAGLSPQQHQALLAIKGFSRRDVMTVGELAQKLQVKHHSAVGLVDRLVKEGMVGRETATDDRRKVIISLTQKGARVLERLSSVHKNELRRIGPTFRAALDQLLSS